MKVAEQIKRITAFVTNAPSLEQVFMKNLLTHHKDCCKCMETTGSHCIFCKIHTEVNKR